MRKLSIQLLLIVSGITTKAQVDLHNAGAFHISSSIDTVHLKGSFFNTSSASFTNNGSFQVTQDITNLQAAMNAGTGSLYLNGSALQNIFGSEMFKTSNLITNNTAGFLLNNELSVSGNHNFVAGIITTSATPDYLVYEAGASYTGDADNRHVNGWVKKLGNTDFIFPVGNETIERTVSLTNFSTTGEYNVRYTASTPNTTAVQSPLVFIDTAEYWMINRLSGGTAAVSMNWNNSKVSFPNWNVPDIRAAYFDGSIWSGIGGSATGNSSSTGSITSDVVSAFNYFTFGSNASTLALRIINFTAEHFNNSIKLSWVIASEENANNHTVQRSDDGIVFYSIGKVVARNRNLTESYFLFDNNPIQGVVYYRLLSTENDGSIQFSRIAQIAGKSINNLKLVSNPAHGRIVLSAFHIPSGLFHYNISASSGQLISQGSLFIQANGLYSIPLQDNIRSGLYILHVSNAQVKFSFPLIIQ